MHETTTHTEPAEVRLPDSRPRSYTDRDDIRGGTVTHAPAEQAARSREPLGRADRIKIALLAASFALVAAALVAGVVAFTSFSRQLRDMQQNRHEEIGGLREG